MTLTDRQVEALRRLALAGDVGARCTNRTGGPVVRIYWQHAEALEGRGLASAGGFYVRPDGVLAERVCITELGRACLAQPGIQ